jgi:hypothetical protein
VQSAGSGSGAVSVSSVLTGLSLGTTYYERVLATNAGGTTLGPIQSFTTPAVLQFSGGQFTANVTAGSGEVVLTRAGALNSTLTVVLSSPGGNGVAPFSQTVTFGPNEQDMTVPIAISNDGLPGESANVIPLSVSSPGPGATLGANTTANLVIVDNNPPLVTLTSLQSATMKLGTGKKGKKASVLILQFSGAVNGSGNLGAYMLMSGKTKKGHTAFNRPVPVSSAVFNEPGTPPNSVTLILGGKLKPSAPGQLSVNATLFTDSFGRALTQSYVATFGKGGVTIQSSGPQPTSAPGEGGVKR